MVDQDDAYRVALQRASGIPVEASPSYAHCRARRPASERVDPEPGRDTRVSMIEEPVLKIRAADDQGLARLELVLSINGEDEQRIALLSDEARPGRQAQRRGRARRVSRGTRPEPGDLISYYVSADELAPQTRRAPRPAISSFTRCGRSATTSAAPRAVTAVVAVAAARRVANQGGSWPSSKNSSWSPPSR